MKSLIAALFCAPLISASVNAKAENGMDAIFTGALDDTINFDSCSVEVDGKTIQAFMYEITEDNACSLNTKGLTSTLYLPHNGCTFDFKKVGIMYSVKVGVYRDTCPLFKDGGGSGDVMDLGLLRRMAAPCFVNRRAKICVSFNDEEEGYVD